MPFDFTSIWMPLGLIGLLGIYMVAQFIQERRDTRRAMAEEAQAKAAAPAEATPAEAASAEAAPAAAEVAPAEASAAPAPAAAPVAAAAPEEKKKRKLRWRTAWIWMPFLIGFAGQAYLTYIKPMLEAGAQ